MHPFLDTSKLTDEDIMERLGKAYNFLHNQTVLGHTPTVISIKEVIQALEEERRTRMQKLADEESQKKNPNGLKPIDLGEIE